MTQSVLLSPHLLKNNYKYFSVSPQCPLHYPVSYFWGLQKCINSWPNSHNLGRYFHMHPMHLKVGPDPIRTQWVKLAEIICAENVFFRLLKKNSFTCPNVMNQTSSKKKERKPALLFGFNFIVSLICLILFGTTRKSET